MTTSRPGFEVLVRIGMSLEINGKRYGTDAEGYLTDLSAWNPEFAGAMAANEGLALSDEHWQVIHFLREYYQEYGIAPSVRVLVKIIGQRLGEDKAKSSYLYRLFPEGPAKQACKYAGLPKPTGCV
jgi:TusE/DsrC/DsvC family sulfur relay protein